MDRPQPQGGTDLAEIKKLLTFVYYIGCTNKQKLNKFVLWNTKKS